MLLHTPWGGSKPRPAACCPHLCTTPQRRAATAQPRRPRGLAAASWGEGILLQRHLSVAESPAWRFPSVNAN